MTGKEFVDKPMQSWGDVHFIPSEVPAGIFPTACMIILLPELSVEVADSNTGLGFPGPLDPVGREPQPVIRHTLKLKRE